MPLPKTTLADDAIKTGVVICGHGSRRRSAAKGFTDLTDRLRSSLPGVDIECAFMSLAEPDIPTAIARLRAKGNRRALAIPGLVFAGDHARKDIPEALERCREIDPAGDIRYGRCLGFEGRMLDAAADRILEAIRRSPLHIPLSETLLVVVGSGASNDKANAGVADAARRLWQRLGLGWAMPAYMGASPPSVESALEHAIRLGYLRIVISSCFLFPGLLWEKALASCDAFARDNPEIEFIEARCLEDHPGVIETLLERIYELRGREHEREGESAKAILDPSMSPGASILAPDAIEDDIESESLGARDPLPAPSAGEVSLVGAGPGDPDLLSVRAMRLIRCADAIVYDRLVSSSILALARPDAQMIYAGKKRADHTLPQPDINRLLVRLAQEGKRVLRLKGGDPFIFGRGGEEIATLADERIPFQVVPGITAASGCAAYAGIPLTHRDHAHSCLFVTGNRKSGEIDLDWEALVRPKQTVVVYMGLVSLPLICARLIEHGLDERTPAALVQRGTTAAQRLLIATVRSLPAIVERERPRPPTLLIIGHVVKLHESLAWFDPDKKMACRSRDILSGIDDPGCGSR
ncbi:MAG: uroporphyrinogen-III C-methyltransferase [Ectothiorhodospiraceae bacterium AqS1]|nr:uroporphyrinogen-III C-methyltransferase [Ectothiorhodospiraceae bacterium AqS1]